MFLSYKMKSNEKRFIKQSTGSQVRVMKMLGFYFKKFTKTKIVIKERLEIIQCGKVYCQNQENTNS